MTVYKRTARGQQLAFDPQSKLPRKLKSILKLIDGKTIDDVYSEKLNAFGDVRSMLDSLNSAGLIQPVTSSARQVRTSIGISEVERDVLMRPRRTDEWLATRSANVSVDFMTTPVGSGMGPDTVKLPQSASLQSELASARALASATDLMSSFILKHLPEKSFHVLKQLDEVTSLDMLAVLMGGYEQIVSHLGEPGVHHLLQIKNILREYY